MKIKIVVVVWIAMSWTLKTCIFITLETQISHQTKENFNLRCMKTATLEQNLHLLLHM